MIDPKISKVKKSSFEDCRWIQVVLSQYIRCPDESKAADLSQTLLWIHLLFGAHFYISTTKPPMRLTAQKNWLSNKCSSVASGALIHCVATRDLFCRHWVWRWPCLKGSRVFWNCESKKHCPHILFHSSQHMLGLPDWLPHQKLQ